MTATGLAQIRAHILSESETRAEATRQAAAAEETRLHQAALEAQAATRAELEARSATRSAALLRAAESAGQLEGRNRLLRVRHELIDEVLEEALRCVNALPDEAYFELLLAVIERQREPGEGLCLLNAKDLGRAPRSFAHALKGLGLTLSQVPIALEGGCLLRYGNIEMNCAFAAMLASDRERLLDSLHALLFPPMSDEP